jgi:hypothetical protein
MRRSSGGGVGECVQAASSADASAISERVPEPAGGMKRCPLFRLFTAAYGNIRVIHTFISRYIEG